MLRREVPVTTPDAVTLGIVWAAIGTAVGAAIVAAMMLVFAATGEFDRIHPAKAPTLTERVTEPVDVPDRLTLCEGCGVFTWSDCTQTYHSVFRPVRNAFHTK